MNFIALFEHAYCVVGIRSVVNVSFQAIDNKIFNVQNVRIIVDNI